MRLCRSACGGLHVSRADVAVDGYGTGEGDAWCVSEVWLASVGAVRGGYTHRWLCRFWRPLLWSSKWLISCFSWAIALGPHYYHAIDSWYCRTFFPVSLFGRLRISWRTEMALF